MNAQTRIEAAPSPLFAAMAKAFLKIEGALKDSNNPHFKTKYADLSSVVAAVKPALAENGLFFTQITHEHDGGVCVETMVGHEAGEQMSFGKLFVPSTKNDAQGYGSALTYARRYSLMAAFGVCPEDDDGNAAAASAPVQQRPQQKPAPAPADEPKGMPDAEWSKLVALAKASGTSAQEMIEQFKVNNLRLLNQDQYATAIAFMNDRLARKAKDETNRVAASNDQFGDLNDDSIPY